MGLTSKVTLATCNSKSMKYILTYLFFHFAELACFSQTPTIQWQKSFGGSLYDKAETMVELRDGGYVIGGNSQSNDHDLTVNLGFYDCWVIKLNNSGNLVWKKSFGGSGYDYLKTVIQTPDNGILCIGETNSTNGNVTNYFGQIDFWVIKLNSNGNIEWQKNYGGDSNDMGYSVCLTVDGAYIIAGQSESNVEENHGLMDYWVLKIDNLGNIIWKKAYGGSQDDFLKTIKNTSDGGYILTGNSKSSNGDVGFNKGLLDVWVVKIDDAGNLQWQNSFGGSQDDFSTSVMEDANGNFVLVGETYSFDNDANDNHSFYGFRDFFVIKINSQGQKIWSKCYGGEDNEYARSVCQNNSGEYVIVGETYSITGQPTNNHGSADYWLIKTNSSDGSLLWQKTYGGQGHDEPNSMLVTFDNNYIVAGNAAPPIGIGDVTQNYGDDDFWIIKLKNEECQNSLTLTKDIPLGSHEFKALENITSQSKLLNNTSNIIYSTGKSITLTPGFKTSIGVVFEAKIDGCN